METNKNIINNFWEYIESQKAMGKKDAIKVYNWLNYDNLGSIIVDRGVFWVEKTCSTSTLPKYAMDYIKNYCRLLGYQYLYDIK